MIKRKNIFYAKALLPGISILLILVFFETAMRLIGKIQNIDFRLYMQELKNSDRSPKNLVVADDALAYKLLPNTQVLAVTSDFLVIYKISSQGLRDKEYSFVKPKNKIRVLAFGDSFTFGEGVSYSRRFTDIAEDHFPNLEIINFGVPGYGLDQILLFFATEGLRYSPDYVVLFLNNVIADRYSTDIVKGDSIDLGNAVNNVPKSNATTAYFKRNDSFFERKNNFILKNSYFLSYLNYRFELFKLRSKLQENDKKIWNDGTDKPEVKGKGRINFKESNLTATNPKRTTLLINRLNEICKQNGAKLLIIKISIYGNFNYLNGLDSNLRYFSLAGDLYKEEAKHSLSFTYDPHFNQKTHSFIASKIIDIFKMIGI